MRFRDNQPASLPVYYQGTNTLLGYLRVDRIPTGLHYRLASMSDDQSMSTITLEMGLRNYRVTDMEWLTIGEAFLRERHAIPDHAQVQLEPALLDRIFSWKALGVAPKDYEALFDFDRFEPEDDMPDLEMLERERRLFQERVS